MYAADLDGQGYVAHLTRVWAPVPGGAGRPVLGLRSAVHGAPGIDFAAAGAVLVRGERRDLVRLLLLPRVGVQARLSPARRRRRPSLTGDDAALSDADRVLAAWARRMVRDPNGITEEHVEELRAGRLRRRADLRDHRLRRAAARLLDGQRHARCRARRRAVGRAPAGVREAVDYGRPASGRTPW